MRTVARRVWDRLLSPRQRAYRRRKAEDDRAFDRAHGSDTGGVQRLHDLEVVGGNAAAGGSHLAAPPDEFAAAMASLDLAPADLAFMDMGSGKGRALLLAADRPFRRLIGVEFAAALHAVAEANVRARAERLGPDPRIELRHGDAAATALPDDPLLLFLFNPFDASVMAPVARRVTASWRANPRPMRVLYLNPVHQAAWLAEGWRRLPAGQGHVLLAPPEDGRAG